MSSKNPDNASSSDNNQEKPSANDDQSPESIAAEAIKAAKASASADQSASDNTDENSGDEDAAADSEESADPLGFDDARMPEAEDGAVDLSEVEPSPDAESATSGADVDAGSDMGAELAAANAKADEHWNRVLRMQADLENERKRTQKQVANAHKFAIEGFVNELLPIKDSLEMGLVAAKEDDADLAKIVEGSELTLKLLAQAFEKFHISEVDPLDEKFDPNVHQAMSMQEAEGKDANTVIGVMQKGYTLNDRLIRPALVTVSK